MLKALAWVIKTSAFALVVLVLANYIRMGNKTVSDQVRMELSHAESAAGRTWVHSAERRVQAHKRHALKMMSEEIPSSERQKLRALMRELNSSRGSE